MSCSTSARISSIFGTSQSLSTNAVFDLREVLGSGLGVNAGLRDLQDLAAKGLLVARGKKKGMRFFLA